MLTSHILTCIFNRYSQEPEKPVQNGERVRWATGNVQINRKKIAHTAVCLRVVGIGAAIDGTGADGQNNPRLRNRCPSFKQGFLHVPRNGSGDQNTVCVAGRGHKLDAKTPHVPGGSRENVAVRLTCIAPPCGNLAQLERSAEVFSCGSAQGLGPLWGNRLDNHILAPGSGKLVVGGEGNGTGWTGLGASPAEQAFSGVERNAALSTGNRADRTCLRACLAGFFAIAMQDRPALEAIGQFRYRATGPPESPVPLHPACFQNRDHTVTPIKGRARNTTG
jgi:hypothetical protein